MTQKETYVDTVDTATKREPVHEEYVKPTVDYLPLEEVVRFGIGTGGDALGGPEGGP